MTVASKPVKSPKTRPAFARRSSAASGLRFCGIMEDPLDQESLILTKPYSADDQSTNSAPKRDKVVAQIAAAARYSKAKSRLLTASRALASGASNPKARAVCSGRMANPVPAQAPAPKGERLIRLLASATARGRAPRLQPKRDTSAPG